MYLQVYFIYFQVHFMYLVKYLRSLYSGIGRCLALCVCFGVGVTNSMLIVND